MLGVAFSFSSIFSFLEVQLPYACAEANPVTGCCSNDVQHCKWFWCLLYVAAAAAAAAAFAAAVQAVSSHLAAFAAVAAVVAAVAAGVAALLVSCARTNQDLHPV